MERGNLWTANRYRRHLTRIHRRLQSELGRVLWTELREERRNLRRTIWRSKSRFWRKLLEADLWGRSCRVIMNKFSTSSSSIVEVLLPGALLAFSKLYDSFSTPVDGDRLTPFVWEDGLSITERLPKACAKIASGRAPGLDVAGRIINGTAYSLCSLDAGVYCTFWERPLSFRMEGREADPPQETK